MTPAEIIADCRRAGLCLRLVGDGIGIRPRDKLTPELAETIQTNKPALIAELRREQFRDHVWQALQDRPDKVKYFEVVDPDADPVRLVLAIRDVGTCDLLIAADKWDPVRFLQLLDTEREAVN